MTNHQEKRVAVYLRVSTRDGRQETENQRLQLKRLTDSMGWQTVSEYEDHESGAKAHRNGFQAMMRDASQRKFDLVLFWALDRFSREGTLQTLKHLEVLESYGVRWRSLTEPWIDSAGPFRDVVIALIASLAKQERLRLSQRVKAGLERARKEGTRSGREIGRPRVIFDREEVVRLRDQGLSWSQQVAVQVGASVGTVRRTYEVLRSSV
jgi:DNA invertase Pin-like site-specific DNA recombinase